MFLYDPVCEECCLQRPPKFVEYRESFPPGRGDQLPVIYHPWRDTANGVIVYFSWQPPVYNQILDRFEGCDHTTMRRLDEAMHSYTFRLPRPLSSEKVDWPIRKEMYDLYSLGMVLGMYMTELESKEFEHMCDFKGNWKVEDLAKYNDVYGWGWAPVPSWVREHVWT